VVAAGGDPDLLVDDLTHQAVLIGDASGPVAGKVVLEGRGLADAFVAVALDVCQKQG